MKSAWLWLSIAAYDLPNPLPAAQAAAANLWEPKKSWLCRKDHAEVAQKGSEAGLSVKNERKMLPSLLFEFATNHLRGIESQE